MRRRIIVLLVIAIALQAPLASFAAVLSVSQGAGSSMGSGCPMAADHVGHAKKSCCAVHLAMAGCCSLVVGMLSFSAPFIWQAHFSSVLRLPIPAFSSRGDAPLIRPPIFATA